MRKFFVKNFVDNSDGSIPPAPESRIKTRENHDSADVNFTTPESRKQAKVSHYTVSKMYRGENVTIDILERICKTLDCSLDDMLYANFENNFERKPADPKGIRAD